MDYFDDLDQTAMDAFGELSCDSAMRGPSHTTALSPDLAIHCQTFPKKEMMPITPKHSGTRMQYLFKLGGNISYELLCAAAILSTQPKVVVGEGENGVAQFCQVNAHDLCTLKEWLASRHPHFRPVMVPINKAYKEFSAFSAYPTLALDTTLPQHRPQSMERVFVPAQQ